MGWFQSKIVIGLTVLLFGASFAATSGHQALAQKQGGGAFQAAPKKKTTRSKPVKRKPKAKRTTPKKPVQQVSYDGDYLVIGKQTQSFGVSVCFRTYRMNLKIRQGRATHKIAFGLGSELNGRVQGNRLLFQSQPHEDGGRWTGHVILNNTVGRRTTGVVEYKAPGKLCQLTVVASKK